MEQQQRAIHVEQLTSGASNRIIPVFTNIRRSIILFIQSIFLWLIFHLRRRTPSSLPKRGKFYFRRKELEEDVIRRRGLAEGIQMVIGDGDTCECATWLFYGTGRNALFCRSWLPVDRQIRGILIIIHGLNEHSGRYTDFARQLNFCNFGVYAMDWIGHGGSDGLHGYVPSLDHVVADTGSFLEKIKSDHPGIPCFLYGHSTGGSVVLKAASYPYIEELVEGVIITSPALRVTPSHPIVGVSFLPSPNILYSQAIIKCIYASRCLFK
ncbi:serine aminopeptidase, S33, Alpha/Beta hydrolase fold protein [Artemisia annua]|uniref:Serine aminopeptidase, S33, Alpha/Beta hydrolase fold protein n=1 Tax=Artemisia annua TaxID=35608 RepID=A0A2U1N0V1_ARTAN|nr:serine aminopeptidase, S33, Alpha/Beta hydrolase fold protein [Artemisia annua]